MRLKEITAEEADALWELGMRIQFYTDSVGAWRTCENYPIITKPFWKSWAVAMATSNPRLAVEVE